MRLAIASLLFAASCAAPGHAAEPWAVPEVARACPQHGPGFVQLPGSTTCVRLGGRVRAETTVGAPRRVSREQISGFGTSARVSIDARTDTAYGPVRAYMSVRAGNGTARRD